MSCSAIRIQGPARFGGGWGERERGAFPGRISEWKWLFLNPSGDPEARQNPFRGPKAATADPLSLQSNPLLERGRLARRGPAGASPSAEQRTASAGSPLLSQSESDINHAKYK